MNYQENGLKTAECNELVRCLRRNTGNLPDELKRTDFFYTALVFYVKSYCEIVLAPAGASLAEKTAKTALSVYFNADKRRLAVLPTFSEVSYYAQNKPWGDYMIEELTRMRTQSLGLLDVMNMYCYTRTYELHFFPPAEEEPAEKQL